MTDKAVKIGFGFFAATSLFFGVVSIKQKINIAVATNPSEDAQTSSEAFNDARLRVLDTDEDGLSDWEELNVHKTSPYLADSDSDGASDRVEIGAGTDPNCPAGRICGSDIIDTITAIQNQAAADEATADSSSAGGATDFSPESQAALDALNQGGMPTPDQIRALLRDSGIPEDQLAETSDEDLIQLFQEVASQQTADQAPPVQ
ncbi:hypothetical protein BK004_01085 [bacterium CG10_46_32]|nr:MAG: hypothetical protein BK004_01085 [bacterium CG10_46_32]PIR56482.1 MAG: hypothetical protein COU73_01100 [Parcubacteria group bacterium CG10_big_fil_rev_8_21_14_0_10_46_32]